MLRIVTKPLTIEIDASSGFLYHYKMFGVYPSFAQRIPNGECLKSLEPMLFSDGVALLDERHLQMG